MTGKKNLRAQEIAMEKSYPHHISRRYAGAFLPMQDEIFPDKETLVASSEIMRSCQPQVFLRSLTIMGSCVAGGAYLPIMSDEALIVEGTGSVFLAGSFLVKSAIGEDVENELLGGATTHSEISGVTDYKMKNRRKNVLKKIRQLWDKLGMH